MRTLLFTSFISLAPAVAIAQVAPEPATHTISGTVSSEARQPSLTPLRVLPARDALPITTFPVRHATVIAVQAPHDKFVGTTVTDERGAFVLQTSTFTDDELRVYVLAESTVTPFDLSIEDCPMHNCMMGANTYGYDVGHLVPSDVTLPEVTIPVESEVSGAFNMLRVFQQAETYVYEATGTAPDPLRAQWRAHSDTSCHTSCYGGDGLIFLLGLDDDSDEFDDDILRHEFGHFVEERYLHSGGPGGFHDGSPTDPRLGWSEGFCTSFSVIADGDPLYLDTNATGGGWYDYGQVHAMADPTRPETQLVSEDMVAESIWQLSASGVPFLALVAPHLSAPTRQNRGSAGVDFVDALDALTRGPSDYSENIQEIVVAAHGFPYGGPAADEDAESAHPTHRAQPRSPITPSRIRFEPVSQTDETVTFRIIAVGRSSLDSAELEVFIPDGATLVQGESLQTLGAIGPDQDVPLLYTLSGAAPDDVVSARLSVTLGSGSAYYMSASYRPLGDNTPYTYAPDNAVIIRLNRRPSLRIYTDPT